MRQRRKQPRSARVICDRSSIARTSLQASYTLGLLSGCSSVTAMAEQGLLPVSQQHACRLLARNPAPYQSALARRLPDAPEGWFLAVDLLTVRHEGNSVEGVGRQFDSSRKAVSWGHTFTSSALVAFGQDPYLLSCDPYLSERMATHTYPKLTPSEALLNVAGDVLTAGYRPAALLADAQFSSCLTMRRLKALGLPFVMRFKKSNKVLADTQLIKAAELAERYPPGRARWYPKLKRYVKRLEVVIDTLGVVDLLLVWKAQGVSWYLTVLVSTLPGGVQAVMQAWNARWSQAVSHRTRKQSLALGSCQCLAFAAHLQHADLVLEAFNLMRAERAFQPGLSWKEARTSAAKRLGSLVLTGESRVAA